MAKKSSITQLKYDKEHIVKYYLKLHKTNDKDIICAIDPDNKQGSIKTLLRKAIKDSN
jgi:translation initiation factor 2 beta subunit (eIF-2beta)/eIF-5